MNTEERFLLRSSVEWRKNLMQDCLCMPCAEFSDSFDAAVDAAIATFPELEREAILKRYRDGLTPTQCANALEIDIGKFYSCFDLAIRRLRHPKYAGGILKEMRRFAGSPLASALKEAIENGNWKKIEELCDSVPFQCLNFSTRTKNCLMFSGAQSIGDVVRLIESGKLKNLRQCGQGTLQNIIDVLEKALPFHFILGKPAHSVRKRVMPSPGRNTLASSLPCWSDTSTRATTHASTGRERSHSTTLRTTKSAWTICAFSRSTIRPPALRRGTSTPTRSSPLWRISNLLTGTTSSRTTTTTLCPQTSSKR